MHDYTDESNEEDALLPINENEPPTPSSTSKKSVSSSAHEQQEQKLSWADVRLIACLILALLLLQESIYMLPIPQTKILVFLICRNHYNETFDPDSIQCKLPVIQGRVASLNGWQMSLEALPGLLTTIYYGSLADRYGRKPIIILALVGLVAQYLWLVFILYMDLKNVFHNPNLIMVAPVFALIGGGTQVLASMVYTMMADAIPQPTRTTALYFFSATSSTATITAPLLGTWLMSMDIGLPYLVAGCLMLLAFPCIFALPETLKPADSSSEHSQHSEIDPLLSPRSHTLAEEEEESRSQRVLARIKAKFHAIGQDFKPLLVPGLLLCFAIILLEVLVISADFVIPQYASNKFGWGLQKTGILQSLNNLGNLAVATTILPLLTAYLTRKRGVPALWLDLNVVRTCLAIYSVGLFTIWLADSPGVLILGILTKSFGKSFNPALMSVATSFVDRAHTARMFTIWTCLQGVATFVGQPMMSGLFSLGLKSGSHIWIGLCYLVASGLLGVALALACRIRLRNLYH